MERPGPLTADDLIQRREELRGAGIAIDVESLVRDASSEVRSEFLERLARIEAAEREVELAWWWADDESTGRDLPVGVEGRYVDPQLREEGGMGYLCSALDVELDRLVAFKVMKPRRASDPAARALFFREAEITARLNHPGVVPIYGRVIDDSGLPAYASAFISGRSLDRSIDEYRRIDPGDGRSRADARASLLRAFLATCEIVAYAHSEKVVHGDIKPLNIMTDDFGATRLVDWGLARAVGDDEREDDGPAAVPRAGTPGFLSSIGGRPTYASDVFALGRTLATILADYPSRVDGAAGPSPDAPRALWAVAGKAARPEASARYPSASSLADDVRAVLVDRAIDAYGDAWPTRLRRWAARNRPAVAVAVALLAAATAAGPIVGIRERALRRRADVERERAAEISREMLDQVDHIGKFQATLPGSRRMLDRAVRFVEQLARDAEVAGDDLRPAAEGFHRAGRMNQVLGRLEPAAECFRKAADLAGRAARGRPRADRAAVLDLEARALRDWGVIQVMRGHSDDAVAAWLRAGDAIAPVASESPDYRLTQAKVLYALGNGRMLSGDQAAAQAKFAEARALLEPIAASFPNEPRFIEPLSDVFSNLGFSMLNQAAPDGLNVADAARLAESRHALDEALRLRQGLLKLEPGEPQHVAGLAATLNLLANAWQIDGPAGRTRAADYYRRAADSLKALVLAYPAVLSQRRELAQVYSNLNVLLTAEGRLQDALTSARSAVEMFRGLAEGQTDSPDIVEELGVALMQQARTLDRMGDRDASSSMSYQAASAMARASAMNEDPGRREGLAAQALSLLDELRGRGYFRGVHAARLLDDPAFVDLRRRDGFPKP